MYVCVRCVVLREQMYVCVRCLKLSFCVLHFHPVLSSFALKLCRSITAFMFKTAELKPVLVQPIFLCISVART